MKECYYAPYSLDQTAEQTLNILKAKDEKGIDVKSQEGLDYFDYYDKLVQNLPSNFSMLQINVRKGYSIVSWLRRFPNCTITAIDSDLEDWNRTEKYFNLQPEEKTRLKILKIDPESPELIPLLKNGNYDIILDHGHRLSENRIEIFEALFPQKLNPDGIYIMEDVFCDPSSKKLIDYAQNLIPSTYKFSSWQNCKTLVGRNIISNQMKKNWKFTIEDISFRRNIISFSKESLLWI